MMEHIDKFKVLSVMVHSGNILENIKSVSESESNDFFVNWQCHCCSIVAFLKFILSSSVVQGLRQHGCQAFTYPLAMYRYRYSMY